MRPALLLTALAFVTPSITPAQWQLQDAHITADLRGIDSLGNGVAWASGSNGTVLRTEDSGFVWQLCATPPGAEKLDFRGIQAFDNNTAIVMSSGKGDLSRLYKTTDGCQTWKLVFTNPDQDGFWDAIQFFDTRWGFLLGDPVGGSFQLWDTNDGGSTWDQRNGFLRSSLPADPRTQGAFAASNSSLAIVSAPHHRQVLVASGGSAGAMIYDLAESGSSAGAKGSSAVSPVPIGHKSRNSGIFSLVFRPDRPLVGVAVGGDYTEINSAANTAAQANGGAWQAAQTPPHGYRSAVAYDKAHTTWITVGPNGTDISTDDGRNWRALKPNTAAGEPPDADQHWNALSLPFVVGPHGRIGTLRPEALSGTK